MTTLVTDKQLSLIEINNHLQIMFNLHIFTICILTVLSHFLIFNVNAYKVEECPASQRDVQLMRHYAQQKSELSLLLYYVSWCNESRSAKEVFYHVANDYNEQIYFAAMDCWHMACNCSKLYGTTGNGTPHKWPNLVIHYGQQISLQYHGDWNYEALSLFVETLFKPTQRVHNKNELKGLSMQSNAVILGLFPNANCLEYRKFAKAAVKWLEMDPLASFRFAVAFDPAANDILGTNTTKPVIMRVNNKGIELFNTKSTKWNAKQIVLWVKSELKRLLNNITGYSTPATVAVRIRNNPVLVIFANNMEFYKNMYKLMENVFATSSILQSSNSACKIYKDYIQTYPPLMTRRKDNLKQCYSQQYLNIHNLGDYYAINYHLNALYTTFQYNNYDEINRNLTSRKLYKRKSIRRPIFDTPHVRIAISKFIRKSTDKLWLESSPRYNRTLSVMILDTNKYKDFLHARGITISFSYEATIFIADARKEAIFIMQEPYSYDALMRFVKAYYVNSPILLSHQQSKSSNFQLHHNPSTTSSSSTIRLQELNGSLLLNALRQQNTTIVLLLYSPECGFSALMSQTLIQLAVLLENTDIKFVRLNAKVNDLPWQWVMPTTPTLIVFPCGRFTESRIFPAHFEINVRNIFGFILAQLEPVEQVRIALSSCKRYQLSERVRKCLQFAKTLLTQHIGDYLKRWQIFEKERIFALDQLKQFKDLTLDIERSFKF